MSREQNKCAGEEWVVQIQPKLNIQSISYVYNDDTRKIGDRLDFASKASKYWFPLGLQGSSRWTIWMQKVPKEAL